MSTSIVLILLLVAFVIYFLAQIPYKTNNHTKVLYMNPSSIYETLDQGPMSHRPGPGSPRWRRALSRSSAPWSPPGWGTA